MNDLKKHIIEKIKQGEIKKESRLRFVAHDAFFWLLSVVSVLFGSISVGTILQNVALNQFGPLRPFIRDEGFLSVALGTLPYIWIGIFLLLLVAGWFNYKQTAFSYRKHNGIIILGVISASFICGLILFATGTAATIDKQTRERVPFLKKEFERREQMRERFIEQRKRAPRGLERPFERNLPLEGNN